MPIPEGQPNPLPPPSSAGNPSGFPEYPAELYAHAPTTVIEAPHPKGGVAVIPAPHGAEVVVNSENAKYVTYQELSPLIIAMLRGLISAPAGAAAGFVIGFYFMGSRDASDLLWGALAGAVMVFLIRSGEGGLIDQLMQGVTSLRK